MTKPYYKPQLLNRLVDEIQSIPSRIGHDVKKKGGFYLDYYLNKCLKTVDRINDISNITSLQKLTAKEKVFNIYFKLQDYKGPEVQYHKKERIVYAGGLGYATLANAVITQRIGKAINHYWKPPKKKVSVPVDFGSCIVYNPKPTMQDWRNLMVEQKIGVLNGKMQ